jgi:hypothetical protein
MDTINDDINDKLMDTINDNINDDIITYLSNHTIHYFNALFCAISDYLSSLL